MITLYAEFENVCIVLLSVHTAVYASTLQGIMFRESNPSKESINDRNYRTKIPVAAAEFADEIREQLKYTQGVTPEQGQAGRCVYRSFGGDPSPSG